MGLRVNGEVVSDSAFHCAFLALSGGRTPQQVQQHSPDDFRPMLQQAERNVLRSVLLQQYAGAQGFVVTAGEIEDERRTVWGSAANQSCGAGVTHDMAQAIAVRKAERFLTRHVERPGRREVEAAYRARPSTFRLPERWLVSHIVKLAEDDEERGQATAALARAAAELARGKAFAAVAERYSDCKGGGSLGWIGRGAMVPEFEAHVFSLPRRTVSPIFATPFGLHIATVHDSRPAGLQPLDEVRSGLAQRIFEDRKQAVLDRAVADLYQRSQIESLTEPERSVADGEKVQ